MPKFLVSFLSIAFSLLLIPTYSFATELPLTLFPIQDYNQNVDHWLNPQDPNYHTPLENTALQKNYLKDFYNHTYASDSPWSKAYIEKFVADNDNLGKAEQAVLKGFENPSQSPKQIIYGENFRPYNPHWYAKLQENMNFPELNKPFAFHPTKRGIVVRNTFVRMIPTRESGFYSVEQAGEGYPFDNFQTSIIWLGAPVYIVAQTIDHSWSLIIASSFMGWVESDAVAKTSENFIRTWQKQARQQLLAITHTETPILNRGVFEQMSYVGTVLPTTGKPATQWKVMVPYRNLEGNAQIGYGYIQKENAALMPLPLTRANFAILFKTLQGRPYGWGGKDFYNDCSQELRSLYTPFGIWLPRNSGDQAKVAIGRKMDLSAKSPAERISYLAQNGDPLLTFVNIGGHVFLYIGNYPNPNAKDHAMMVMTYQDMWGLKPTNQDSRAVIGGSVFFPLLLSYPENTSLNSPAKKAVFKVVFLGGP